MPRRKSPQDKKWLSYVRDRRNGYGENDKSSRKSIRRNKRAVNSANRRGERLVLNALAGTRVPAVAEAVEDRLLGRRPKSWRKWPDMPLGEFVALGLQRRVRVGIDSGPRAEARVRRVRQSLRQLS